MNIAHNFKLELRLNQELKFFERLFAQSKAAKACFEGVI